MTPTVSGTQAVVLGGDDDDAEDVRYLRAIRSKQARALARSENSEQG